jgi:hypothetical protein
MGIFGFKRVDGGMKTDRELLELAAKAAGIDWDAEAVTGSGDFCGLFIGDDTENPVFWNPLTDDGDALRLAVKLGIDVDFYKSTVEAWRVDIDHKAETYGECAREATRRAIVRAAAEIGAGMAEFPTADQIRDEWT